MSILENILEDNKKFVENFEAVELSWPAFEYMRMVLEQEPGCTLDPAVKALRKALSVSLPV